MRNDVVKKGDLVRVCYGGKVSKTLFKAFCYSKFNCEKLIVEVDPIKNKEDRHNIRGWFGNKMIGWKTYGFSPKKLYWTVGEWEKIKNNKLKI